jgi:GNAT superfamily N-acetyltransferase
MKVADAGDRGRFSWRVARRHDVVVLRDFELGDQPEVRRLILSGMRERWRERYDDAANPDVDDMSSYLANGGEVVVWEEHGAVVATGTLALEPDGGGRTVRLSIDRSYRRRGLRRRIVDELVERAERRRFTSLRVTTDTPWRDAVGLYASCGFEVVEQTDAATYFSMSLITD